MQPFDKSMFRRKEGQTTHSAFKKLGPFNHENKGHFHVEAACSVCEMAQLHNAPLRQSCCGQLENQNSGSQPTFGHKFSAQYYINWTQATTQWGQMYQWKIRTWFFLMIFYWEDFFSLEWSKGFVSTYISFTGSKWFCNINHYHWSKKSQITKTSRSLK